MRARHCLRGSSRTAAKVRLQTKGWTARLTAVKWSPAASGAAAPLRREKAPRNGGALPRTFQPLAIDLALPDHYGVTFDFSHFR
jgi:hypothetical protein